MTNCVHTLPAPAGARVGGKAANLGRLMALGLPVPRAAAVTADIFVAQMARSGIARCLAEAFSDPDRRTARLAALREAVAQEPLGKDLQEEIAAAVVRLGPGPLAVRSSAIGEDSQSHSFAGQHDTFLSVEGLEAIFEAIGRCWASAFSDRAVEYRERCGLDPRSTQMGVVLQRMVAADLSGVLFTCDPVEGRTDRLVIEAVAGLGEGLVSGRIRPDRWVLDRDTLQVLEQKPAGPSTGALLLDPKRVVEVARCGLTIERAFGGPQDIELAFEKGRLQILQTRPVTTRVRTPDREDRIVWSNTNLGELAPDVATPMTFWVVRQFLDFLMRPLLGRLGIDLSKLDLLGMVAGRIYLNMNATIALMRTLPGMRRKSFADFFGGDMAELGPALLAIRDADLPKVDARSVRTLIHLPGLALWLLRHANMEVDGLMKDLAADTARLASLDPAVAADGELLERVSLCVPQSEEAVAAGFACAPSVQWFAAACRRWLGDADGSICNRLLSGLGGVDSAEAGLDLWRLAVSARPSTINECLLSGRTWVDVRSELQRSPEGRRFADQWNTFMERHGHHTRAEIDVAVARWREEPNYVLSLLRGYLDNPDGCDPLALHEKCRTEREELFAKCRDRLGPFRRRLFDWLCRRAQVGVTMREWAKSDLVRRIALTRRNLIEAGKRLVERGALDSPEDVFFLYFDELGETLRSAAPPRRQESVAGRRADHAQFAALTPPPVVVGRFDPVRHAVPSCATTGVLRGLSVSPGIAVGPARVILRADLEERVLPGEILVAPFTDPGWTPYFLPAAAIVMDQGGMLSHGSIVARELGVPAVVNVGPATRVIRTGQLLRVDAHRGEVSILDEATQGGRGTTSVLPDPR